MFGPKPNAKASLAENHELACYATEKQSTSAVSYPLDTVGLDLLLSLKLLRHI